jgi:hypothetical protein
MPRGIDYMNFVLINLGFFSLICILYYWIIVQQVKADWVNNRCNPMFMMFADDVEENFSYCIQNIQGNYMGYLLQPLTYITSGLTNLAGEFGNNINNARYMVSNIRDSLTNITQGIFGVFLNIIIEFQKMIISMKDLMGKIVGTISVFMYILSSAQLTMQSMWNGPPGQLVKGISGACFGPYTKLRLKNGILINIKDLDVGHVLFDGSVIDSIIKIKNRLNEPLYKFEKKGEDGQTILVSGTHFVFFNGEWIQVKDVPNISKNEFTSDILYNLITNTSIIKIGSVVFHDYEDDELMAKYNKRQKR